jgi:enoyl-CoA hydratase/carnithine racemase
MVRFLNQTLGQWQEDDSVKEVRIRGSNKNGPFGVFCAGGDIRFFHEAACTGNPELEDFFTEEYSLNFLIANYKKPYIAFMDGIVMGGGMGISQGASIRIVTEKSLLAMPETGIGLFPDVGGGYFLSRCPGNIGEYLGLTGQVIKGAEAIALGLADYYIESHLLAEFFDSTEFLTSLQTFDSNNLQKQSKLESILLSRLTDINTCFSADNIHELFNRLNQLQTPWSFDVISLLEKKSALMLAVSLEQIKRARKMNLAQDLVMERNLVRHCFATHHLHRLGQSTETVEGIRALAIDKDHSPRWQPQSYKEVSDEMVQAFFESPWPDQFHPLNFLLTSA